MDALTRREWVKEDELANELKTHPKVLRRVLRYFEQVQASPRQHVLHSSWSHFNPTMYAHALAILTIFWDNASNTSQLHIT